MSMHGDNSEMIQYNDWNSLYETDWPIVLGTYSKKWAWHHSQQPMIGTFTQLPAMTQNRPYGDHPYKRGGPNTYSKMYRRTYATVTYTGLVNDMGDL